MQKTAVNTLGTAICMNDKLFKKLLSIVNKNTIMHIKLILKITASPRLFPCANVLNVVLKESNTASILFLMLFLLSLSSEELSIKSLLTKELVFSEYSCKTFEFI